jgi:heme oxygenase (mycobilin-producing)
MSMVVINAVRVPAESRDEFEARFAARAGQVSKAEGFEGFELLRPRGGEPYLVYTRWRSEDDFQAWMRSTYFAEGHQQHRGQGPVSTESEVWSFDVLQREEPAV